MTSSPTAASLGRTRQRPASPVQPEPLLRRAGWAAQAEWTKLRSVRSTVGSLVGAALVGVGLAAAFCFGQVSRWDRVSAAEHARFDAAGFPMNALFLVQLIIASLGVLAVTAEYTTGTIRASIMGVPARGVLYVAKAAVLAATTAVMGLLTCLTIFLVGEAILGPSHRGVGLSDPPSLRIVVGGALYLTAVALLGMGLGAVLRNTAAGIGAVVGVLFVVPILANFLPSDIAANVNKWLPTQAGFSVLASVPNANDLAPWTGLTVLAGYALLALVAGAVVMVRRDA